MSNTRLYILMYHHFVEDGEPCGEFSTTVSCFREDLQWLTDRGYVFLLPRDLAAGSPLPEKAVMITMDDGYQSNYHLAFPILQEFRATATIALVTTYVDTVGWALTWDMCREMAQSGLVEFGSHTDNLHKYSRDTGTYGIRRLRGESRDAYEARVLTDLQASIHRLEDNLDQAALYFAYPFGRTDAWAADFLSQHFSVTVTTREASADLSKGLYKLPRYNINTDARPWDVLR